MDRSEALSALQAKHQAEVQIARAATCPPWRHAVFGILMGGLVASPAFDFALRSAILVIVLCMVAVVVRSDRRRLGMFINGYRRGKTRVVALGTLFVELSLYMLSAYYGLELNARLMPLLLGLLAVPIGVAGSITWQRVFVREMGA